MTKDEALKLAHHALELANYYVADYCNGNTIEEIDDAIIAIGKVLAEQDSKDKEQAKTNAYINQLDKALAQPEQEPVAWSYWQSCLNDDGTQTAPWVHRLSKFKPDESIINKDIVPLYTTPPQEQRCYCGNIYRLGVVHREDSFCDEHPRKPLTNEDIALINWESLKTKKDCVRAIEAAHNIKE